MKLLFLDFDGVLNSEPFLRQVTDIESLDRKNVEQLNALIEKTEAHIVVSSSWRHDYPNTHGRLVWALERFGFAFKEMVIGVTPKISAYDAKADFWKSVPRSFEIDLWRRIHNHDDDFAILDDLSIGDLHAENFVQTNPQEGLTAHDVARVVTVYERQAKERIARAFRIGIGDIT